MFLQAQHSGRLGAMANGRVLFGAKVAAENAAIVSTMGALPFAALVDGTDKGNPRAKSEIWTERAKFDAAAAKFQDDSAKLHVAAKSGNFDQLQAAVGAVGAPCKACHDACRRPAN